MARQRAKHSGRMERIKDDKYVTPMWCCARLAEWCRLHLPVPEYIVDIGAGDGRIGRTVRDDWLPAPHNGKLIRLTLLEPMDPREADRIQKDELEDGDDVLSARFEDVVDDAIEMVDDAVDECVTLYVSNPPFALSEQWVRRVVKIILRGRAPRFAAFLLRLDWLGTKRRSDIMEWHPPRWILPLSPRPSFAHGRTDAREYAWFVWDGDARSRHTCIAPLRK